MESKGTARKRRAQGRRADARHLAWALSLFQGGRSHHTGAPSSCHADPPRGPSLEAYSEMSRRVSNIEKHFQLLEALVGRLVGQGPGVGVSGQSGEKTGPLEAPEALTEDVEMATPSSGGCMAANAAAAPAQTSSQGVLATGLWEVLPPQGATLRVAPRADAEVVKTLPAGAKVSGVLHSGAGGWVAVEGGVGHILFSDASGMVLEPPLLEEEENEEEVVTTPMVQNPPTTGWNWSRAEGWSSTAWRSGWRSRR